MRATELIYNNGIADKQLIEYLIAKHKLQHDVFAIVFIEKAVKYAMEHKAHSRDRAAEFLADIIPDTEFFEVAAFFEDDLLTNYGLEQKENFWQILETFTPGCNFSEACKNSTQADLFTQIILRQSGKL